MEKPEGKLSPPDPEREKHLWGALAKGDIEFFERLGGSIIQTDRRKLFKKAKRVGANEPRETSGAEQKRLEDESPTFGSALRGSRSEFVFRALAEEYPELGLSFKDDAKNQRGQPLPDYVAIHVDPYKTDLPFLRKLTRDQRIHFVINGAVYLNKALDREVRYADKSLDNFSQNFLSIGRQLEARGVLKTGWTERLLSLSCMEVIESLGPETELLESETENASPESPLSVSKEKIVQARKLLDSLGVKPLGREEFFDSARAVIRDIVAGHRGY